MLGSQVEQSLLLVLILLVDARRSDWMLIDLTAGTAGTAGTLGLRLLQTQVLLSLLQLPLVGEQ